MEQNYSAHRLIIGEDEIDEEMLLNDVSDVVYSCIYDITWLIADDIRELAKKGISFKEVKDTIDDSFKKATHEVYKTLDFWKEDYFKEGEE